MNMPRQAVSPGAMRMLAWLETRGPSTRRNLAQVCYLDQRTAARYLAEMMRCDGLVHIKSWARLNPAGNGQWSAVYAIGPGTHAKKPKLITMRQKNINHRRRLENKLGRDLMQRVLTTRKRGGADTLVIDGRTVYRRGEGMLI